MIKIKHKPFRTAPFSLFHRDNTIYIGLLKIYDLTISEKFKNFNWLRGVSNFDRRLSRAAIFLPSGKLNSNI